MLNIELTFVKINLKSKFNDFSHFLFFLCIFVNTNSKYKEDDFTGSIAVNCFQDVCTHSIHFRLEAHTCKPRSFVSHLPPYTPQPSVRLGELGW